MEQSVFIERNKYLQALIDRMHNGMVKVVTGIRRSGKSFLLFKIFRRYLRELGVGDDHVIAIALDQRQNRRYRDPDAILQYIEALITDGSPYYIMIDEVQMLAEFEEVINSLLHLENADVYVTGSNSKFLSKDVITEFRGRGDEVHVYPLSFREYMQVYEGDVYHCWSDYVVYGGLPLAALMRSEARKVQYLSSLFAETYLKDIIERNHIVKTQELEDLINVLASSIGSLTNANKIAATYKTKLHSSLSANTIRQYIDYLEDAYIVSAAQRYDVKGRKYIGALVKYYFEDVGLRNARLGFRQIEETHLMENVVYNELRGRGYSVDVGIVELRRRNAEGASVRCQREIDFVANLGSRRYYIQSAFSIPDMDKWEQEKASLCGVKDAFKKIVLVKDVRAVSRDESGIMTMSIYDFLLNEDSLEL